MIEQIEQERPRRGRPPRVQQVAEGRRRRKAGTLDRMAQFKLDCIDPEALDLDNYVYYWGNDENGNLRHMTQADDYDFVTAAELGQNFDADMTDSESTGRVRMLVGNQKSGAPLYSYLCKKPRAFWEADNAEMVRSREDMMAGRVYRAEAAINEGIELPGDEDRPGGADKFYASKGNTIGHAAERRRGPVPARVK
jgi:hypothetical protein